MEQMELGKFIAKRRKELGISQNDLANFLNVSVPTISKWESGMHLPDLSIIGLLAKILKVDLISLINNESNLNNNYDIDNEFNISNFSKYFSYLRKVNNYSLKDLERLIDVRYQTISKWENGESLPNIIKLVKCSELFKVPVYEIYYGKKFEKEINENNKSRNRWLLIISIISLCALLISILTIVLNNEDDNNSKTNKNNSSVLMIDNSSSSSLSSGFNELNLNFNDKVVVYDGEVHSIYLEGVIPKEYNIEYINNDHINVGVYEIIAKVSLNNELIKEYKAMLIINKAPIGVSLNNKTISYDGKVHSLTIEGELPKGVSVEYINNLHKSVGEYEVVAILKDMTGNYDVEEKLRATMSIVKDGKYHDVYFCYEDGTVEEMIIPNGEIIPNIPKLDEKNGYSNKWVIEGSDEVVDETYKVTSDLTIVSKYTPNTYKVIYKYNNLVLFEREATYDKTYTFENYELTGDDKLLYWIFNDEKIIPNSTITFNYLHDIVLEAKIGIPSNEYLISIIETEEKVIFNGLINKSLYVNTLEEYSIPEIVYVEGKSYRVTHIAESAFKGYEKLKKVVIPEGVRVIGTTAFDTCVSLEEVTLPSTILSIEGDAFKNCYSLKKINIPSLEMWFKKSTYSDTCIFDFGAGLYINNELQEEIIVPSDIDRINSNVLLGYKHLTKLVIGDNITRIDGRAFETCVNLQNVVMGKNVNILCDNVFKDCKSLKEINIPSKVTGLGSECFGGCISLDKVVIEDINSWININLTNYQSNPLHNYCDLYIYDEKVVDLVIPEGTIYIKDEVFRGCTSIETIELPLSVTHIGVESFSHLDNLKYVVIKENISKIDSAAFMGSDNAVIYIDKLEEKIELGDQWKAYTKAVYYKGEWEYIDGVPSPK